MPNDNAKLEFKPSLGSGATCISFYYHMLGRDVGALKVSVNGKQAFLKAGTQGDKWNKADFKVQEQATSVSTNMCNMHISFIIIKFRYNARSDWLKQRALSEHRCTE